MFSEQKPYKHHSSIQMQQVASYASMVCDDASAHPKTVLTLAPCKALVSKDQNTGNSRFTPGLRS
jgi:hypothetical protein